MTSGAGLRFWAKAATCVSQTSRGLGRPHSRTRVLLMLSTMPVRCAQGAQRVALTQQSRTSGTQCWRCASTTMLRQGFSWQQDHAAWQCCQQRACSRCVGLDDLHASPHTVRNGCGCSVREGTTEEQRPPLCLRSFCLVVRPLRFPGRTASFFTRRAALLPALFPHIWQDRQILGFVLGSQCRGHLFQLPCGRDVGPHSIFVLLLCVCLLVAVARLAGRRRSWRLCSWRWLVGTVLGFFLLCKGLDWKTGFFLQVFPADVLGPWFLASKPRVGGTVVFVVTGQTVGDRRSAATVTGRRETLYLFHQPVAFRSSRLVPNFGRCGVISYALSRQPLLPSMSLP